MATLSAVTNNEPANKGIAPRVDMKFEVVVIPVADVDRSKEFDLRNQACDHIAPSIDGSVQLGGFGFIDGKFHQG